MRIRLFLVVALAATTMSLVLSPVSHGQRNTHASKLVAALSQGKASFGISSGSGKDADTYRAAGKARAADKDVDFLFMSMAGMGQFNVANLKAYMQGLLDGGAVRTPPSHQMLLRIPTWHEDPQGGQTRMSQALDAGVFTIMLPHVETAAEAAAAIGAMRYSNASTANGAPMGTRPNPVGDAPSVWGVTAQQYRQTADVWPLNPNGNLANVILLESVDAIEKFRREITAVPGVSIAIPAPGDLRSAYTAAMFPNAGRGGGGGRGAAPAAGEAGARGARGGGLTADQQAQLTAKLEEAFAMQMATCKELNVVCGITAGEQDIERRVRQGFRFLIANSTEALRIGRAAAGRMD